MFVEVKPGTTRGFGTPQHLFTQPDYGWIGGPSRCYAISKDGKRFIMVQSKTAPSLPVIEVTFLQNWCEELKRLVPTGKK